jgi:hypothetical protein
LSRFERNFGVEADAPLSLDELLTMLGDGGDEHSREDAIACYLSGSEGWRDAVKRLGGAFAEEARALTERKAD